MELLIICSFCNAHAVRMPSSVNRRRFEILKKHTHTDVHIPTNETGSRAWASLALSKSWKFVICFWSSRAHLSDTRAIRNSFRFENIFTSHQGQRILIFVTFANVETPKIATQLGPITQRARKKKWKLYFFRSQKFDAQFSVGIFRSDDASFGLVWELAARARVMYTK